MQVFEMYRKAYAQALIRIREERSRFEVELDKISGIRVISSQANYVMVEIN